MQLNLTATDLQGFQFTASMPSGYNGKILAEADILAAVNPLLGHFVKQQIDSPAYSICLNSFHIQEGVTLKMFQPSKRLVAFLALKNQFVYELEGIGEIALKAGQFAFLHSVGHNATIRFPSGGPMECLEMSWPDDAIKSLSDHFDFLKKLFHPIEKQASFLIQPASRLAGSAVMDQAQHILGTSYKPDMNRFFFETRTKEYLGLLLMEAVKKNNSLAGLLPAEWDAIQQIGKAINTSLRKTFAIKGLSQEAGMSETKFKQFFKAIFSASPGQYHMRSRMLAAKKMLLEDKLNPKEVSVVLGYKDAGSFSKQFHKFFKYWPSEITDRSSYNR